MKKTKSGKGTRAAKVVKGRSTEEWANMAQFCGGDLNKTVAGLVSHGLPWSEVPQVMDEVMRRHREAQGMTEEDVIGLGGLVQWSDVKPERGKTARAAPRKANGKGARGGASGLAPRAIEADRNLGTGGDTVTAPMTVDDLAGLRNYADPKEDRRVYPSQWDHGFLVYPKGSARIGMRRASHITPDQWGEAVRLLRAGHVIAFNANENEGPDIACDLAQRCKDFRIGAVCPGDDELIVYFLRVDEANSE